MNNEPPECSKCFATFSVDSGYEMQSHGMCWPCASVYAERLEGALELIARTSTKDVERVKKYAQKMLKLHGSTESRKR